MVFEVRDPHGVVLPLETSVVCGGLCHYQHVEFSICYLKIQVSVVSEKLFGMLAANLMGKEVLSRCGVRSTLSKNLQPCFSVWVLNMLHCDRVHSMGIR